MGAPTEMRNPPSVYVYETEGWDIWAGRTASDNDRLSIKVARGNDWWFHVRGMPGSHVVLFVRDGQEPPKHIVEAAAALAAYHSKQRNGGIVSVSGTRAKFVSKPRGAKPGTVSIKKESIFKVRPGTPN
ncbi:MAG: NFACT RNA binding domain-containing protein [Myxococcota bacterium]|nr:NFACT RNA binding domain-containing protein [Myxococcota bacterium]